MTDDEHSIERVNLGAWQQPDLRLARCACGWESQRAEKVVVEEEVRRHLAASSRVD